MKTTRIKALRGFYVAGKEVKADKEAVVPDYLARELIAANKAVAVVEAPKAKSETKAAPQAPAESKE